MKKRRVVEQMKVKRYTIVEPVDSKGFVVVRRVGGNVDFRVRANTLNRLMMDRASTCLLPCLKRTSLKSWKERKRVGYEQISKMLVLKGIPSLVVSAFTMLIMVLVLVVCLMSTGCGTVGARGYAERTGPDGVVTRAAYTAIGFGEKSAMALEGLGIDGDAEAPGVFLQQGNPEQATTQLMQSLIPLGAILGPIVQQRFASNAQQQTGVSSDSADENSATYTGYQSFTQANTGNPLKAATQNSVVAKLEDRSIDGGDGSPTIVILGNRAACSYCKTLWSTVDFGAVSAPVLCFRC
jgi:hypothetical protein